MMGMSPVGMFVERSPVRARSRSSRGEAASRQPASPTVAVAFVSGK